MKKQWKVIRIVDSYSLLINAGTDDGIKVNDNLVVYVQGDVIFDPETKESLGTFDFIKANLVVDQVFEKMSLCLSNDTYNGFAAVGAAIAKNLERTKPFEIDPNDLEPLLSEKEEQIKIGDLVRLA